MPIFSRVLAPLVAIPLVLAFVVSSPLSAFAQETAVPPASAAVPAEGAAGTNSAPAASTADASPIETAKKTGEALLDQGSLQIETLTKTVDQDPNAKAAAAGILAPIYQFAEFLSFPTFHWLAFALMVAGVVSYALQLVLGKLVVLTRMGFSVTEILSDAVGLAISLIGLVLTTQAATENSTFTQSAAVVLSSTAAGGIFGFVLYLWGQSQELQAVRGRSVATSAPTTRPPVRPA